MKFCGCFSSRYVGWFTAGDLGEDISYDVSNAAHVMFLKFVLTCAEYPTGFNTQVVVVLFQNPNVKFGSN